MILRRERRFVTALIALGVGATLSAPGASAHPLGNLTKNTATTVLVSPDGVAISAVLDLAEIPALQATQTIDERSGSDPSGSDPNSIAPAARSRYAQSTCVELAAGLHLIVNGAPVALRVASTDLTFPPGQGGLFTLRLTCALEAPASITAATGVSISDTNLVGSIGWREITVIGNRTVIDGAVSRVSTSATLTQYPSGSPKRTLSATFTATPGGVPAVVAPVAVSGATTAQRRGSDGLTARFSDLLAERQLTWSLAGLCALIAFALGAIHSLAPGHGKTMMAAAVVSRRGTVRQVVTIGATVAATHTTGVLALGSAIWLSQSVAPDDVLPWLTVASGALVIAVGVALAVRRLTSATTGHAHSGHTHGSHAHGRHTHGGDTHASDHMHDTDRPIETRWVVLMGLAGGLVPTPSALVVLLGATALGRAWFGVVLVAIYGVGMAATLLVAGVLAVRVRAWLEQRWFGATWFERAMRIAPVVTSGALILGGTLIVTRGASGL
jgi:nickel/cobalt transporter (NicO) family protein